MLNESGQKLVAGLLPATQSCKYFGLLAIFHQLSAIEKAITSDRFVNFDDLKTWRSILCHSAGELFHFPKAFSMLAQLLAMNRVLFISISFQILPRFLEKRPADCPTYSFPSVPLDIFFRAENTAGESCRNVNVT